VIQAVAITACDVTSMVLTLPGGSGAA